MRIVSSLVLLSLVTFSPLGRAETTPLVVVERSAGAERCPDAEAITVNVEQIRGRPAIDPRNRYRVTFARTDDGFSATLRSDTSAGSVRTLEHDSPNCSALGHAVALTLALLLDSDLEPKKKVDPPPPPPRRPSSQRSPRDRLLYPRLPATRPFRSLRRAFSAFFVLFLPRFLPTWA